MNKKEIKINIQTLKLVQPQNSFPTFLIVFVTLNTATSPQ